jgi:tyrosyl-tRNA synthetase
MENTGHEPEIVIATGLIEGTDGTGAKMSKSKGNYVGLAFEPRDVFGKLMSAADRLMPAYLRALTELLDPEIDLLMQLSAHREIHPMGVKTLLAADVTAAVHGIAQAETARAGFTAQFSAKRFSGTPNVPVVTLAEHADSTVAELFAKVTRLVPSLGQVRRVAAGGGLRLVTEVPAKEQEAAILAEADATATLGSLLKAHKAVTGQPGARNFLKCGRFLIETK